jgi:hypothetical protein
MWITPPPHNVVSDAVSSRRTPVKAERTLSIAQTDRLARALGTTLSEMFVEVEPEVIPS